MTDEKKKVGREKKDIKVSYKEYCERMKARNETPKPYATWVRKIPILDDEGKETGRKKEIAGESGETPQDKAIRLGKTRMNKVLHDLKGIKNLASPQYKFTDEQINKMNTALKNSITDIENAFKGVKVSEEKFEL